ncbi:FUSC family protein [Aquabacter cavernae]|uniref:FUSC family protein n=1 Tax=Aquabacter cavernae TaxID=2496029 RepID=UPI000F8EBFF2|nr:FUSC family protein [Aquabacter cavernae]
MAAAADHPWHRVGRQVLADLLPFEGRFAMAWRVALLCALVAGTAMIFKVPESAIGCYLIIFLYRPDGAEGVGQAIGIIALVSIVVLAMAPVIQATADSPLMRLAVIAGVSFAFVFLGSASVLGEQSSIVALVVAFILTLVDRLPAGEIATRGLLYAAQMACMPMVLMIGFNLVLGTGPHTLLRRTIAERLLAGADALEGRGRGKLNDALGEGRAESDKQVQLAGLFHTTPAVALRWLAGAAETSYRYLIAVAALSSTGTRASASPEARERLAATSRTSAAAIAAGRAPAPPEPAGEGQGAVAAAWAALAGLARPDGGSKGTPAKTPFLKADAFTNPDHQRYALKTTGAAVTCYLVYSLIDWSGIHTAMITCYVAALGTTGETVHKLALRICGCLIGAAMGIGAILFVIPHLSSVGGLMVLVFLAILPAAWVSVGSERISYGGVQIGLAFLLTILNGFAPSLDMDSARDRVMGILLGNLVVYLFFTGLWPKSAVREVHERLARVLGLLARLAAMGPQQRYDAVSDAALVESELAAMDGLLDLLPFEPARARPSAAAVARMSATLREARDLLPLLMLAPAPNPQAARHLSAAAARLEEGGPAGRAGTGQGTAGDDIAQRAGRIAHLVAA